MSDVVLGALIGVSAAVVGAVVQGLVNRWLQVSTEARGEARQRREARDRVRLEALDQAHRLLVVNAEYARASALGESAEQVASLRRQSESSNFLMADVTLVDDAETVAAFLERTQWWLSLPKGTSVQGGELETDAQLGNRLQAAFRKARERVILADDMQSGRAASA